MKLSPIKKKRVYQEVIERIKDSIEQGSIKAGNKQRENLGGQARALHLLEYLAEAAGIE